MRLNVQPRLRERARASMVLATPGTSSKSTWPSAQYAASVSTISLCLPTITFSMLSMMRLTTGRTGEFPGSRSAGFFNFGSRTTGGSGGGTVFLVPQRGHLTSVPTGASEDTKG